MKEKLIELLLDAIQIIRKMPDEEKRGRRKNGSSETEDRQDG